VAIRGDDPWYDVPAAQKDAIEARLRAEARRLARGGGRKAARRKEKRAKEISRRKSKRAHKGTD
jgi:hypothetical protein